MFLKLVVGLGNYFGSYQRTPHNIGFDVVDGAVRGRRLEWRKQEKAETALFRDDWIFVKPCSYMNTSGAAVRWAKEKWNADLSDVLLVCDDFSLPWGRVRLRRQGSAGGHKGLESVIQHLGSDRFPRLRVGVGPVPSGEDPKEYVLKRHPADRMYDLALRGAAVLETVIDHGVEFAMNRHNAAKNGDGPADKDRTV